MTTTMSMEDLIPDEDTVIAMTHLGYIKRMDVDNFRSQNRGGKGIKGMQTIEEDYIEDLLMTTNHHYVMCFYQHGPGLPPEGIRDSRGRPYRKGHRHCEPAPASAGGEDHGDYSHAGVQ